MLKFRKAHNTTYSPTGISPKYYRIYPCKSVRDDQLRYLNSINQAPITNIERMHDEEEDDRFKDSFARVPKHKDDEQHL